jgi:hypothetical protein
VQIDAVVAGQRIQRGTDPLGDVLRFRQPAKPFEQRVVFAWCDGELLEFAELIGEQRGPIAVLLDGCFEVGDARRGAAPVAERAANIRCQPLGFAVVSSRSS